MTDIGPAVCTNPPGTGIPSKKPHVTHRTEGESCRKCGTAIEKRMPGRKARKATQSFYYAWYLYCPGCRSMNMVEEAKVSLPANHNQKSIFDDQDGAEDSQPTQ